MKKIIIYLIILIVLIATAGVILHSVYINKGAMGKEECEKNGGLWGRFGMADINGESCNPSTSDFGKKCLDNKECQGLCLAESLKSASGSCSQYEGKFGCMNVFLNGEVVKICID